MLKLRRALRQSRRGYLHKKLSANRLSLNKRIIDRNQRSSNYLVELVSKARLDLRVDWYQKLLRTRKKY